MPIATVPAEQGALPLDIPPDYLNNAGLVFSDQDVAKMREGVLIDALTTALDARNGSQVRAEAMDWIMDDAIHPFSFRVCAQARGTDPDELRESFLLLARQRGLLR